MAYLNKVMLMGGLGKDPEIKTIGQSGTRKAAFSLAVSKRYRDNNGEQKEQTDWINVVAFGKTVDLLEQLNVAKGTQMFVEGEIHNRSWTDQTSGQKRSMTEITMLSFQLIGGRSQGANNGQQNNPYSNGGGRQYGTTEKAHDTAQGGFAEPTNGEDDDLPF